jgi:hypothetical protein
MIGEKRAQNHLATTPKKLKDIVITANLDSMNTSHIQKRLFMKFQSLKTKLSYLKKRCNMRTLE